MWPTIGVIIANQDAGDLRWRRVEVTKAGLKVTTPADREMVSARDDSAITLSINGDMRVVAPDGHLVPLSLCRRVALFGIAISPNGRVAACINVSPTGNGDSGTVTVFSLRDIKPIRKISGVTATINGPHSLVFSSDRRLLALSPDRTCAGGNGGPIYPTRLRQVDFLSGIVTSGPCTLTVVSGSAGTIISRQRDSGWEFSTDNGTSWHPGEAQLQTPDRTVYYLTGRGELASDTGGVLLKSVISADWSGR